MFPRMQTGPNPQHLLVTLMGDYWTDGSVRVPSQALVALLAEFGISERSARTALARLLQRDMLAVEKQGRHTFYTLSRQATRNGRLSRDRLLRLGHRPSAREWDGAWLVLAYSAPTEASATRTTFRSRLRASGFAPLQDAVWVAPSTKAHLLPLLLREFPDVTTSVFTGEVLKGVTDDEQIRALWDLGPVAEAYHEFVRQFTPTLERMRHGEIDAPEALRIRTRTMDQWRGLRRLDPDLPEDLAPADWVRPAGHELLVALYDGLGPLAERACREIVARFESARSESTGVRHYSIASYLDNTAPA